MGGFWGFGGGAWGVQSLGRGEDGAWETRWSGDLGVAISDSMTSFLARKTSESDITLL